MTTTTTRIGLVPVLLLAATAISACGNDVTVDIVGQAGVTVDGAGEPVALVQVCRDHIDRIEVVGSREGLDDDEPNPVLGAWTSDEKRDGTVDVALRGGAEGWTAPQDVAFADAGTYVLTAGRADADVETTQVSFTGSQLAELDSEHVLVDDGEVVPRTEFDEVCASGKYDE